MSSHRWDDTDLGPKQLQNVKKGAQLYGQDFCAPNFLKKRVKNLQKGVDNPV